MFEDVNILCCYNDQSFIISNIWFQSNLNNDSANILFSKSLIYFYVLVFTYYYLAFESLLQNGGKNLKMKMIISLFSKGF
jgi:hypothetical protein